MIPMGLAALLVPAGTGLGSEMDFWGRAQARESLQERMQNICLCQGQIVCLKEHGTKGVSIAQIRSYSPVWCKRTWGGTQRTPRWAARPGLLGTSSAGAGREILQVALLS